MLLFRHKSIDLCEKLSWILSCGAGWLVDGGLHALVVNRWQLALTFSRALFDTEDALPILGKTVIYGRVGEIPSRRHGRLLITTIQMGYCGYQPPTHHNHWAMYVCHLHNNIVIPLQSPRDAELYYDCYYRGWVLVNNKNGINWNWIRFNIFN